MAKVAQWTVFEATLESENEPDAPLWDVTARVEFSGPEGAEQVVHAFWDGGRTWRVRFSPDRPGRWRWRCRCAEDAGLDGREGRFECVPYRGDNPLYRHGEVRLSVDRRHFVHADGTPFLWLGDTAWNGALRSRQQDWEHYLRVRRTQGFSAVQFVTTQWRAFSKDAHGQVAYLDGEKVGVNPAWFQRLDPKVAAVNAHGLVAAPVVLWAAAPQDPGRALSVENAARLARYICSRYGAYQVIWLLGGDGNYGGDNAARWRRIAAEALPAAQPRLTTLHFCGQHWPMDDLRNDEWLDFVGYQSGHGSSIPHVKWLVQGPPSRDWLKEPVRPIVNLEPNYEGHPSYHGPLVFNDWHVRRALYWSLLISPPAGVTYGNNSIWLWAERPEVPEGHEAIGQVAPWRNGLEPPGVRSVVRLARFFGSIPWRTLRPAPDLLQHQPGAEDPNLHVAAALSEDRKLAVVYTPKGGALPLRTDRIRRPAGARWFDPRKGRYQDAGQVEEGVQEFRTPDAHDWVLLIRTGG